MNKEIKRLLKKHAKNFVTAERYEGKLEGIHFDKNGSIYVTDAHQILAFHDVHREEPHTIHYQTGEKMDIAYPNLARLLAQDYSQKFVITMKNILDYVDLVKVAAEIDSAGSIYISNDGQMFFQVKSNNDSFQLVFGDSFDVFLTDTNTREYEHLVHLNTMYFYHMLHFFKDARVEEVIFSYRSRVLPVSFRAGNYEIIIMPVRRG
jgi:hypothetical protein